MWRFFCGMCMVLVVSSLVLADQEVPLVIDQGQSQAEALHAAFDTAIAKEMETMVGPSLAPSRQKLILSVLDADKNMLISGYNEVPSSHNGTDEKKLLVRINAHALRARLHDLGVLATLDAPMSYVLILSGVEPSLTKRLGALQEISGLVPRSQAEGDDIPELRLSRADAWMGVLSYGDGQFSHSAKTLDEVWFFLWKGYFSRFDKASAIPSNALQIRVSGWLSGQGPMEFDRMLEGLSAEIDQKSLVGVEMDGPGMATTWIIQSRSKDAVLHKIEDAVRAQGLVLEVF